MGVRLASVRSPELIVLGRLVNGSRDREAEVRGRLTV